MVNRSLSVLGLPSFATFVDNGNNTGTLDMTPAAQDRGNFVLTLQATDTGGGDARRSSRSSSNSCSVCKYRMCRRKWRHIGDKVAVVGEELFFTVSDLDQDPLTYSATNLPSDADIRRHDRLWSGAIPLDASSQRHRFVRNAPYHRYRQRFAVLVGSDAKTINIAVRAANQAPLLQTIGPRNLSEGSLTTFTIVGIDADNDPLTFSAITILAATFSLRNGDLLAPRQHAGRQLPGAFQRQRWQSQK